ncbi:hypothetical protein PUN28_019418 [Cardiocondyla obscurior]|uniref:Tropomyosin n=1 Tax=Cardiocondyla obscurior TaxID=286306 RepID=A0AAW2ECQ0_9HYME
MVMVVLNLCILRFTTCIRCLTSFNTFLMVNAVVEEARNTVKEEIRLANDRYKTCLVRMEVERAALDEKLAQRDAEITKLSMTLEELRSFTSFSQSLQLELDKVESELAEKKQELRLFLSNLSC